MGEEAKKQSVLVRQLRFGAVVGGLTSIPIVIGLLILAWSWSPDPTVVIPVAETEPVRSASDAANDICIWHHPTNLAKSTIIGADKDSGLMVYDLAGHELQYLPLGRVNSVDVRYNFPLVGEHVALVVATNRSEQALDLFKVVAGTRTLRKVGRIPVTIEVYGCCLYFSIKDQVFYCFATSGEGQVQQIQLSGNRIGEVTGKLVRTIQLGSHASACVADDELGFLYLSEEDEGIWKFHADAGVNDDWREEVCPTDKFGVLKPKVQGLTVYCAQGGKGYLIASSQGSSRFVVFRREKGNDRVGDFGVKNVSRTDGIDVTNVALGKQFADGLLVVQDDFNSGLHQNFKLVRWGDVARTFAPHLFISQKHDPRTIGPPRE